MAENVNNIFMNHMLTSLLRKIEVPGNYHDQVKAVKTLLTDDVSGLIDMLLDFAVETASVQYSIETDNPRLTDILNDWLQKINFDFNDVPTGIDAVGEEYFKERWKSSSFPILKISKWKDVGNNLIIPSQMFILDGESVHAKAKEDSKDDKIKVNNYNYYLGITDQAEKLGSNCIITKPFGRLYEKYPTPFLVKRGCYHNWKLINSLKDKESSILDQVIPYLLLIRKGSENLAINQNVHYTDDQLNAVIEQFQEAINDLGELSPNNSSPNKKTHVRATNFDEKIEHMIPDLKDIFDNKLFEVAEKGILSGLGFIDIAEGVSANRKESILNPKPFIQETKKGVKDFKNIIKELVYKIIEKNKDKHKKYANVKFRVISSPITGFMTDKFKERVRQCWDRGKISNKTAIEVIAEMDFETEVKRREQEAKDGVDVTMYPNVTENREGTGMDIPGDPSAHPEKQQEVVKTEKKEKIPDAKKGTEKKNFKASSVEDGVFDLYTADLEVSAHSKVDSKNYVRFPQLESNKIEKDSYRTLTISEKQGIKVIYVREEGKDRDSVKSFLFNKDNWDEEKATTWLAKNKDKVVELVGSPYKTIKELPPKAKDNLNIDLQRVFMKVFNKAYNTYENDTLAFRVAWSSIKKIAKQDSNGKWVRKTIIKDKSKKPVKATLTREMFRK